MPHGSVGVVADLDFKGRGFQPRTDKFSQATMAVMLHPRSASSIDRLIIRSNLWTVPKLQCF